MAVKILWISGSSVYIILGTLHMLYTFFSNKFLAEDNNTVELMKQTHPRITNDTTMWKAWIGFNASHSSGAIFFGTANILLAVFYFDFLIIAWPLIILTLITSAFYFLLAVRFWFKIPLRGIALATICYIAASIIILL